MSLFRLLFGYVNHKPSARVKLGVESLEGRVVPAAHVHGWFLPGHSAAARGLVTERQTSYDYDGDGQPDELYGGATAYNAKGQVVAAKFYGDFDNDGVYDYTVDSAYRYDNRNLLTGETILVHGVFGDVREDFTFTNDAHGNRLTARILIDDGADGTIDAVATQTNTYDVHDNQLTTRFAEDVGND